MHVITGKLMTFFAIPCRYQTNMSNEMLAMIVSIQPKDSSGAGGETRETTVYKLADDMLDKLPADYVQHEVIKSVLNSLLYSSVFGTQFRPYLESNTFWRCSSPTLRVDDSTCTSSNDLASNCKCH